MRKTLALTCVAVLLSTGSVMAAGAGTSMFSIGLSQGTGDFAGPEVGSGYVSAFSSSEIGVTGEYWHMFSSDYAFALQATYGFASETDKPGSNAGSGAPDLMYSTTSFKIRVGGDRVGQIGDRFTWFFGPGLEYWSGKAEFENFGFTSNATDETESTTRIGINGRVGGVMKLSDAIGIQGQIGNTLGYASAEQAGAKATWYPSSFHASWGLLFAFGGE